VTRGCLAIRRVFQDNALSIPQVAERSRHYHSHDLRVNKNETRIRTNHTNVITEKQIARFRTIVPDGEQLQQIPKLTMDVSHNLLIRRKQRSAHLPSSEDSIELCSFLSRKCQSPPNTKNELRVLAEVHPSEVELVACRDYQISTFNLHSDHLRRKTSENSFAKFVRNVRPVHI
jgi:hypothetical protein